MAPSPHTEPHPPLPSGVVTFLLTDVVGSSALWESAPDAMTRALARHDILIRASVENYGGALLKPRGEGDSTFSVFSRATDALNAARSIQRNLVVEPWPAGAHLRVRVALHTGEAVERDGDYFGPTVNRAARLRELAPGGDVVMSQATAEILGDRLPVDCTLVDLGRHELRALSRAEHIYRLELSELAPREGSDGGGRNTELPTRLATPPAFGFHGRTPEQHALRDHFSAAARGERRIVFLAGEPGIGKTALAGEVARGAHASGATVLYGRCDEELGAPYQPWIEALGHLAQSRSELLVERLGRRQIAELGRLVPSLAESSRVPALHDGEANRYLLFRAVSAALRAVAHDEPLVVILDDLHWADPHTLQLLRHVASDADPWALLIVATYRDSEPSARGALADLVAALRREAGVERLSLTGLTEQEVVSLAEAAAGQAMGGAELELVHALSRETEGNPFFAWEMLRHLMESGAVALDDGGRWVVRVGSEQLTLPDSVRDVVGRRVARLGERVQHALAFAAVIGRDFGLDLLATALDVDPDALLDDLEEAEVAGLVTSVAPGHFTFTHALVPNVLVSGLTPTRRARAHHRIAEAMGPLGLARERVAEVARHHLKARPLGDARTAAWCSKVAGDAALESLAPEEATRWYREALDVLADHPDERLRCEILLGVGVAQKHGGDPSYRQTLLEVAELAGRLGHTEALVSAALANTLHGVAGEVDHARIRVLEAALDAVGTDDSGVRARLLATLATELLYVEDHERRRAVADEALAVARRLGDPAVFVATAGPWANAVASPATYAERDRVTDEAVALAGDADPSSAFLIRYARLGTTLAHGDLAGSQRYTREISELADEVGLPRFRHHALGMRADLALLAGDAEGAERLAGEAFELATAAGLDDALTIYGAQLLAIRLHQGRADELVDVVADMARTTPGLPALHSALALLLVESGRHDEVERDPDAIPEAPFDATWLISKVMWAEVATQLGDRHLAGRLYPELEPFAALVADAHGTAVFGAVAHALGGLAAVLGRWDLAETHLAAAEVLHEQLQAPFHLARTWLSWGLVLLARGDPDDPARARELLARAASTARTFGCANVERRALEAIADLA